VNGKSERNPDIPPGYSGVLELLEPLPVFVSAVINEQVVGVQRVLEGATAVEFQLSVDDVMRCFGDVSLSIADPACASGDERCRIRFSRFGCYDIGGIRIPGYVHIRAVETGPVQMAIMADGHARILATVEIHAGIVNDIGTYVLEPGVTIRGQVVDERGDGLGDLPLAIAPINAASVHEWSPGWQSAASANNLAAGIKSDVNGVFRLSNVKRGEYAIFLGAYSRQWVAQPVVIDASSGEETSVVLHATRGVRVRVDISGPNAGDGWLEIFNADDIPVAELKCEGSALQHGVCLPPGQYSCIHFFGEGQSLPTRFDLEADVERRITIPH
jgi:hypothetical protein